MVFRLLNAWLNATPVSLLELSSRLIAVSFYLKTCNLWLNPFVYTWHLDVRPALHQPELMSVYAALGTCKRYECWDSAMRWKRALCETTAQQFAAEDPSSFHFTRVHAAMEEELAKVGGWKCALVMDGVCMPRGHRTVLLKLHTVTWSKWDAFRCPPMVNAWELVAHCGFTAQWTFYHNGVLLKNDYVTVSTGDFSPAMNE